MQVRVRYAPSPTGLQHIGSMRTALFNYLFAKSLGGTFILRLEDTDRTRCADEYVKNLYDTFQWLGFYWDEGPDRNGAFGPYVQSERFTLYKEYAEKLVSAGKAYYCFCADDKNADKLEDESAQPSFGYTRSCRSMQADEARRRAASGEPHVIRLKIPLEGTTAFDDILLGRIEWKNVDINPDPVLLKSDGFPTYHLANVVDDHSMGITHVMRAQEWIPSAPLHIIMYDAFGWEPPLLCHLPMVLGADGHKLSKRHGATAVDEFRKKGYLEGALINYVAMLGCSYEDGRDIYGLEDLARLFKMERINKSPAVFDYTKLEWFNGQYIRMLNDDELAARVAPFMAEAGFVANPPSGAEMALLVSAMPLVKERLKFLSDAAPQLRFFFERPKDVPPEEFIPKKSDAASTKKALLLAADILARVDPHNHDECETAFREGAAAHNYKLGDVLMPLRVAVTGSRVSPPLFQSIALLGKDEALSRAAEAALRL